MNEKFGILDNATILDKRYYERKRKAGQMALALSSFKWNEVVYRSFLSGNLKRLDMELFRSLRSSVAKRMYRFLDKRFFHRAKWGFDLHNFAFEKIGLSRSYAGNAAKIREKLGPAIEELEERGYLEPLPISKRYVQVRKGEWQVFFLKRSVATDSEPLAVEELANEWESALTSRGVGHAVASELVAQHGDVVVKEKIEFHDWLLRNKDSRIGKNPAGFLVASIRGNYPLPKGFETEEMRQGKLQKAAEKKRRETEHEKIRAERENAEKEAERRIVDEFMASLGSDEARQSFEEEAVREDSFLRTFYTKAKARGQGEDFKMYRELILRNAIKRRQVEVVV